jgi:redox-sensing transcriptional repressor
VVLFDNDPKKIGSTINGMTVVDSLKMVEEIHERGLKMAMLAVPADKAQEVANKLIEAGIEGILNYAPINLSVPANIRVQYIDPVIHLQRMTFYIEQR